MAGAAVQKRAVPDTFPLAAVAAASRWAGGFHVEVAAVRWRPASQAAAAAAVQMRASQRAAAVVRQQR